MFITSSNLVIHRTAYDTDDTNLEQYLYEDESLSSYDEDEITIITFDDICEFFKDWQNDDDCDYDNVYNYIRDCISNGFHPVADILDPNTFECKFSGKSGNLIIIDRYGPDDYSATWYDTNTAYASFSVRGSYADILKELKEEI